METTEIKQDIGLITKLFIWARCSIFIIGLVSIGICVQSFRGKPPGFIKAVELAELDDKVMMLADGIAQLQDTQTSMLMKAKK